MIFSILAQPFGWILQLLYGVLGKYWLAILIFSVAVRLALYPVHKKQILSTVGMSEMTKKSQEIQKKYAGDREMINKKTQELYEEAGYNPMSGCLPMLIQVIVISGLFMLLKASFMSLLALFLFTLFPTFLLARKAFLP